MRRFIAEGKLHAYPRRSGFHTVVWLDADEVLALDKSWVRKKNNGRRLGYDPERGRFAHIAFKYFADGCFDLRKIVLESSIDPVLLRDLYKQWLVSLDAFVSAEQGAKREAHESAEWDKHERRHEKKTG